MKIVGYAVSSLFLLLSTGLFACELAVFEKPAADSPLGVTLAGAERIDEAVGYCQLEGMIANSDDGQSRIRFRLRLPDEAGWNGRFLMLGNGGTAGAFQGENRAQVALQLGYATGQTDTGHTRDGSEDWLMREMEDGSALPNTVTIEDFGHRSIHLTTVVGKQLVDAYYAAAPEHSYYFGCSTGGRQGLKAMQRYPADFDGIVAGAPVFSLTRLNMSQVWMAQEIVQFTSEHQPLSEAQLDLIHDGALAACDAHDGVVDRLIDDPRQCGFDPGVLQCSGSETPPLCLTEPQVDFVRMVYDGPITEAGERLYPGRVPGGEGNGRQGWQGLLGGACHNAEATGRCDLVARAWFQDPGMNLMDEFDINDPADVLAADTSFYSGVTRADNPDVTPFVQRGGKAILYHGWSDTNVSPTPTVELYEAMQDTVSRKRGADDIRDHVRLFMAPGMAHCGGGEGPNNYAASVLTAIDAWVSEGDAPDAIVATHEERGISRPWCPYPQVARLTDPDLDPGEADNFQCVAPPE